MKSPGEFPNNLFAETELRTGQELLLAAIDKLSSARAAQHNNPAMLYVLEDVLFDDTGANALEQEGEGTVFAFVGLVDNLDEQRRQPAKHPTVLLGIQLLEDGQPDITAKSVIVRTYGRHGKEVDRFVSVAPESDITHEEQLLKLLGPNSTPPVPLRHKKDVE